jgi:acyl-coenzyme A thioesterase PaaI-like protein
VIGEGRQAPEDENCMNVIAPEPAIEMPEGYVVHGAPGGFVHRNGPVFIKYSEKGSTLLMRLGSEHTNAAGFASGGLLMMLLDIALGTHVSANVGTRAICPTVQLNCNMVSAARVGDDLVGESELTRLTRTMAFASGHLRVGDRKVATATAIFHIPAELSVARNGAPTKS